MADDITDTEGLRLIAWSLEGGNVQMAEECRRAADEIERLREAGNKMVKALVDIGGLLPDEYNLIETWKRLTVAYPKVD